MPRQGDPRARVTPRHGLARILSKRGICSRTEAAALVRAGRVRVGGRVILDPEHPTALDRADIVIEGAVASAATPLYLMLNKPRGLVTTVRDEQGRDTVYRCLAGATLADGTALPWVAPVGRLDKASEGLLLFTNDPAWAARVASPEHGPAKTYHVQVDCVPDADVLASLERGVQVDGDWLSAARASLLRHGARNAWLEVVLEEGRNRQIRRLLAAHGIGVLRLVRVAIGPITLGALAKGAWRMLTGDEVQALAARAP